jgi:hypothetical protein
LPTQWGTQRNVNLQSGCAYAFTDAATPAQRTKKNGTRAHALGKPIGHAVKIMEYVWSTSSLRA